MFTRIHIVREAGDDISSVISVMTRAYLADLPATIVTVEDRESATSVELPTDEVVSSLAA